MYSKTLCEADGEPEQGPRDSGIEIIGHHIADHQKRLEAFEVRLR